jgi:hypothetical protein
MNNIKICDRFDAFLGRGSRLLVSAGRFSVSEPPGGASHFGTSASYGLQRTCARMKMKM